MAYYAQIVNNLVIEVIEINDDIIDGAQFAHNLLGGQWIQTFIGDPNKNFAGVTYTYDASTDNFYPPPTPEPEPRPTLGKK